MGPVLTELIQGEASKLSNKCSKWEGRWRQIRGRKELWGLLVGSGGHHLGQPMPRGGSPSSALASVSLLLNGDGTAFLPCPPWELHECRVRNSSSQCQGPCQQVLHLYHGDDKDMI